MNKDKESKSEESTPRNKEEDNNSGHQLKFRGESEGLESWINAKYSVTSSGRRPSSWDDSDDELFSQRSNSFSYNGRIYSEEHRKSEEYISAEINQIKTQYFQNLNANKGLPESQNFDFEAKVCKNIEDKGEIKLKLDVSDRRQKPARIRRRTKSSSSSSPVLEHSIEYGSVEYQENVQCLTSQSYRNPSWNAEFQSDTECFIDHFFTEQQTKRVGFVRLDEKSSPERGKREENLSDFENCSEVNNKHLKSRDFTRTFLSPKYNPDSKILGNFESEEPITYIYKTSRKLSQILEVEETKKSKEVINLSEEEGGVKSFEMLPFSWDNSQKPPDDFISTLPDSRHWNVEDENDHFWNSIISLRELKKSPTIDTSQLAPKKSASLEKPKKEEKPKNHTKGSLSERFNNFFTYNDRDNIIILTGKIGKTQLGPNSKKEEGNNCELLKDSENIKISDGLEVKTSLELLKETGNVDYKSSTKIDVIETKGSSNERTSDSVSQQKNLSLVKNTEKSELKKNVDRESFRSLKVGEVKTPDLEERRNSQRLAERNSDPMKGTILSSSENSTPRKSSRTSYGSGEGPEHFDREHDFCLTMVGSNHQSQRATLASLKTEEVIPVQSSGESRENSSYRLKDASSTPSGQENTINSQRICENSNSGNTEDKANFLHIDLEKICYDSSTPTESNNSSFRTCLLEDIKDFRFNKNNLGQSTKSSLSSESPKKMKNSFPECLNSTRSEIYENAKNFKTKSNKTDFQKFQKSPSSSLKSSRVIFENFERKAKSLDGNTLKSLEEQISGGNSECSTTRLTSKINNNSQLLSRRQSAEQKESVFQHRTPTTKGCRSVASEGTIHGLPELKSVTENLQGPITSSQNEKCKSFGDVSTTISEQISPNILDKTWTKWRNIKSFRKSEEEVKVTRDNTVSLPEPLTRRQRGGEEFARSEDFKRNLFLSETKDVIQEIEYKNDERDDGAARNCDATEQLLDDMITIDKSENCLEKEKPLSPFTNRTDDISYLLEKTQIHPKKSSRGSEEDFVCKRDEEKGETERCLQKNRSIIRTGSGIMSITNETRGYFEKICSENFNYEKCETKILKSKSRPSSEQTAMRTLTSSRNSGMTECHISSNISEPESYRSFKTERCQKQNEKLENTTSKASSLKGLKHKSFEESVASTNIFQNKFEGEMWSRLIDAFEGSRKLTRTPETKFPDFHSLNQTEFTECNREETQDFIQYKADELNEFEDFFTSSRRLIEENKSCSRSAKSREDNRNKGETLESLNPLPEDPEERIKLKNSENLEKNVHDYNFKGENFEIGEFGDGNRWHDGKPDISELEKPKHHGDGNQERRHNCQTLAWRIEENKEEKEVKSRRQAWVKLEGNIRNNNIENKANLKPIFIARNINHSKSESYLSIKQTTLGDSKISSQRKTNGDEKCNEIQICKQLPNATLAKASRKRKRHMDYFSDSTASNRFSSEEGEGKGEDFHELNECWHRESYSSVEGRLITKKSSKNNFDGFDTVVTVENQKKTTNHNILLAEKKNGKAIVKANNWLIIKDQEGKQSRRQRKKIRKLKIKLKKGEKMSSSKEPLCANENLIERPQLFVPTLQFGNNSSCLQNFYKRLFNICCLTSNSSAATSI